MMQRSWRDRFEELIRIPCWNWGKCVVGFVPCDDDIGTRRARGDRLQGVLKIGEPQVQGEFGESSPGCGDFEDIEHRGDELPGRCVVELPVEDVVNI